MTKCAACRFVFFILSMRALFNITEERMLDSIYHMALYLIDNRVCGVKMLIFCNIYATFLWASLHNVTIDFI